MTGLRAVLTLILSLLAMTPALAKVTNHLSFDVAEQKDYFLRVSNSGAGVQPLWLRYFNEKTGTVEEDFHEIQSSESKVISLKKHQVLSKGVQVVVENIRAVRAQAYVQSDGKSSPAPLTAVASNSLEFSLNESIAAAESIFLSVYNPTHVPAVIALAGTVGVLSGEHQIAAHGRLKLPVHEALPYGIHSTKLHIQANTKLVASLAVFRKGGAIEFVQASPAEPLLMDLPQEKMAYFAVGHRDHGLAQPNFVIAIRNPKLINEARALLEQPEQSKIVVGKIAATSGGFNRDFAHPSSAAWNWHVSEVVEFNDFGSQKCDGDPQTVELLLPFWVENIGSICFWNYVLIQELTPNQVETGLF